MNRVVLPPVKPELTQPDLVAGTVISSYLAIWLKKLILTLQQPTTGMDCLNRTKGGSGRYVAPLRPQLTKDDVRQRHGYPCKNLHPNNTLIPSSP